MAQTRTAALFPIVPLLALGVLLPACGEDDGSGQGADLGNRFVATAERPYSFDYPSEWTAGEEGEGDLALGIDHSVGMVLEPVHPWGGMGTFGRRDVEEVEVDGYEAHRMLLDREGATVRIVAYRINADGTDLTLWFFAEEPAQYDEDLVEAIMDSFRVDEGLLDGSEGA